MFCKKCNKEFDDSYAFCPFCGTAAVDESTEDSDPGTALSLTECKVTPADKDKSKDSVRSQISQDILKWGILSLAFSVSYPLSPIGFFFSFAARKHVKEYELLYGQVTGKSRVGRDLGKAGFIVGLIFSIILILSSLIKVISTIISIKVITELFQYLFGLLKSLS